MKSVQVVLTNYNQPILSVELHDSMEVGRQRDYEPDAPIWLEEARRLIIVPRAASNVSRVHVTLNMLPDGRIEIINGNATDLNIVSTCKMFVDAKSKLDLAPPFSIEFPETSWPGHLPVVYCLQVGGELVPEKSGFSQLNSATRGPKYDSSPQGRKGTHFPALDSHQLDQLADWLQHTGGVIQAALGEPDFLEKACQTLVELVDLGAARVLLKDEYQWNIVAQAFAEDVSESTISQWVPSRFVLNQVVSRGRTFFRHPFHDGIDLSKSIQPNQIIIAAPIKNADLRVIGILYGERLSATRPPLSPTGKLEAALAETLAVGVSAGLAREEQQQEIVKQRLQFEQFFGPQLASELRQHPDLLLGRKTDVTVLFCDLKGFSRITQTLEPAEAIAWINDILSELTACVMERDGVVVDYVGDALMAMWGAPWPQADHAQRACQTALAMLQRLPDINQRWDQRINQRLVALMGEGATVDLGIGINTGLAQVGNTGSTFKFKYGPLGNEVNLASRVQGMTKYLKSRCLITAATRERIGAEFSTRRVVKTRVVNINKPVDLYEVSGNMEEQPFFQRSEAALDLLEQGRFAAAAQLAGELLLERPGDGPLILTLSRASQAMFGNENFSLVWLPPGK